MNFNCNEVSWVLMLLEIDFPNSTLRKSSPNNTLLLAEEKYVRRHTESSRVFLVKLLVTQATR